MDEILEIEQEFIEQAKAEMAKDPKLRPCRMCVHFDGEKQWCSLYRQPKMQYNYGGNCFITNETALRALFLQEKQNTNEKRKKLTEKMDVMASMVTGAWLIHGDISEMIEDDYRRLEVKAKSDDATYQRSRRNLDKLHKCFGKMKIALQDFESAYREYIERWNAEMFADEKGMYSPEYDKFIANGGFVTAMFFAIHDKCFENTGNVERIFEFLGGLEGRDILEESDLKKYMIKIR